ncbi:hypothetical protein E4M08_06780 [Histophilus somni]|uniref:hypothetical protein n=1 Tax=Histophilus somni TaxID=731 RepID=UPI001072C5DD|nr:hypothetical protein [Histophilus somni]TFI33049.1 hypothetical protein E4M08_06780 [Histophilus somni]THA42190.1 hypothetical protein E5428_07110 [Histophilus somni]THA44250.1 hypothetical protein E5429_06985 [Histophilus somni]
MRKFVLIKNPVEGSIASTTTVTGCRTRKTCDFFVSQILLNHGITTPVIYSEFAIRLISRNKVGYIRTNKANRVTAVVETVSHLLAIYFYHLLKTVTIMKKSIKTHQKHTALCAIRSSIVSTVTAREGIYA